MSKAPRTRSTFGQRPVDQKLTELLHSVGTDKNDDLIRALMITALDMDEANVDRRELKIASQALAEILNSWRVFAPFNDRAKVTVFGSARTKSGTPDYELARNFSAVMTEKNWMTITGAGPGIMTAGIEGAGIENALGVSIVLPSEDAAADIIDGDSKLATFRYFFTRKLAFMKETDAFALFPGGFGTLDEAFELLTLIQTGKSYPAPIVMLDNPKSEYWSGWKKFVEKELQGGGMINDEDMDMFLHTHDPAEAAEYICAFYSCYHSIRFVGKRLVIRLRHELNEAAIVTLNQEFGDIVIEGGIEPCPASKAEIRDDDLLDLPRLSMKFDNMSYARLTAMIHRINDLGKKIAEPPVTNLIHDVPVDELDDSSEEEK